MGIWLLLITVLVNLVNASVQATSFSSLDNQLVATHNRRVGTPETLLFIFISNRRQGEKLLVAVSAIQRPEKRNNVSAMTNCVLLHERKFSVRKVNASTVRRLKRRMLVSPYHSYLIGPPKSIKPSYTYGHNDVKFIATLD